MHATFYTALLLWLYRANFIARFFGAEYISGSFRRSVSICLTISSGPGASRNFTVFSRACGNILPAMCDTSYAARLCAAMASRSESLTAIMFVRISGEADFFVSRKAWNFHCSTLQGNSSPYADLAEMTRTFSSIGNTSGMYFFVVCSTQPSIAFVII